MTTVDTNTNPIDGSFADSEGFEPLSYQKRSSSVKSSEKDLHLDHGRRENGMKHRWKALVLGSSIVTLIISYGCYHHLLRHDGHKGSFLPMNDNSKSTSTTSSYDQKNVSSVQALKSVSILEDLEHAAVAADHPICSKMGLDILQKGGNAVDAAVTVALCLGVANPASSGLGGGAFLLIHAEETDVEPAVEFIDAREKGHKSVSGKITEVIDCREVAPAAATTNMYKDLPNSASELGGLAIGTPGELKGLELAHTRHGRLSWYDVVNPAYELAASGVPLNANAAHEIGILAHRYSLPQNHNIDFGLRALLTHNDSWAYPLTEGDVLKNPKLAETLEAIRDKGADALYKGELAAKLANDIKNVGGIVTQKDIESYKATLRTPVVAHDISGFSIVGVPPPSSGGAAIIGAARFLASFQTPYATFPDTLSIHRLVEACKHAFAIRMSLSDPAYNSETVQDAVNDLIQGPYMPQLSQITPDDSILPLSQYGGTKWAQLKDTDGQSEPTDANEGDRRLRRLARRFGNLEDNGTSHFSIVDKDGNAVSMTTSINTYFGSNVLSPSTGIVLSNTMDDFSTPGKPNYFGLHPSTSNYIKPFKKPLSSMSPTMVFRRPNAAPSDTLGDLMLVVGASGGPKIISAVFQVISNFVLRGMPLFEAIVHPRIHDQLIYHGAAVTTTENTVLETGPGISVCQKTRDALKNRGHRLLDVTYEGTVQAVSIDLDSKKLSAACDVRKGGFPAGY